MGREPLAATNHHHHHHHNHTNGGESPLVLGLQPSALVDHVARVDWSLLDQIPGERGGSIPVLDSLFNHRIKFYSFL